MSKEPWTPPPSVAMAQAGMTAAQIAAELGMGVGSVRLQLGNARRKGCDIDPTLVRFNGYLPGTAEIMAAARALEALPPVALRLDELVHVEGVGREHLARLTGLSVAEINGHLAVVADARSALLRARQEAGRYTGAPEQPTADPRAEKRVPSAPTAAAKPVAPTQRVNTGLAVEKRRGWRNHSHYFGDKGRS